MSHRGRVIAFMAIAATITAGAGAYAAVAANRASVRADLPPEVAVAGAGAWDRGPRVVFRNTEVGSKYGLVAMVSLADPAGPRAFTPVACDRVYAVARAATCLRTRRGVVTTFEASQLDADWSTVKTWALPGVASRTRMSSDGRLLATTSFVTGHSYLQVGFSTGTEIRGVGGKSYGDLEKFALKIGDKVVHPIDRNIWGVTFGPDDDSFYATVATGGKAYLVRGSLAERTLTSLREGAECPSLSPDGTHIAYKHRSDGSTSHWSIAVLELATGREITLAGERRSVDDQVEWLDDNTLLYGLPRVDEAGVSDIWKIDTERGAEPSLFIGQAWSPSVVRS